MTFTLEQIHAVEAKAFYSDDGVGRFGAWLGSGGVDEEGGCRAGAIFHVWNLKRQSGGNTIERGILADCSHCFCHCGRACVSRIVVSDLKVLAE